jgi:outer membrane protein OmpA-like peptidoglycan-associated protein
MRAPSGRALALAALLGAAALAGCASKDNLVVVMPDSTGQHVGTVVVYQPDGTKAAVLDKPYAAVGAAAGSTRVKPVEVDQKEVEKVFGAALAARPIPPQSFTLYFESGTDILTPESSKAFEAVFQEIAKRKAAEVVVTGYTDTVASAELNDQLSLQRAETVRRLLIERGVKPEDVVAVGRGERELLVPTGNGVAEPRNRRVVITVR